MIAQRRWLLGVLLAVGVGLGACSKPKDPSSAEYWIDRLDQEETREEALRRLGELKDKKAVPVVLEYLKEPGKYRGYAAQALGLIGDPSVVPSLLKAVDLEVGAGADEPTRYKHRANERIVQALGALAAKDGAEVVLKLLSSRDSYVRLAAVRALGEIGSKSAVPALSDIVRKDDNMFMKKTATEALGEIGDAEAIPVLVEAMFIEKGASIYPQASLALASIGAAAVPALVETMHGKNAVVQKMAEDKGFIEGAVEAKCAEVLGDLRAKQVEPEFVKRFKETKNPILQRNFAIALGQLGGPKAVEALSKAASEPASDLRQFIVDALNELSDRSALPALLGAAKAGDVEARRVAFRAFTRLADGRDLAVAVALAKGKDELAVELAKEMPRLAAAKECGDNSDCWLGKLKDKEPKVRDRAAYALGRIGDKKTVDPLVTALQDEDLETRYAIIWALARVGDKTIVPRLEKVLKDEGGKAQFMRINEYLKRLVVQLRRA